MATVFTGINKLLLGSVVLKRASVGYARKNGRRGSIPGCDCESDGKSKGDQGTLTEFCSLDLDAQELISAAIAAREYAYCPYSKFKVGAALRGINGKIYTGCNVENGAYPAGICAERTAACKAVSEGQRQFCACAVVAYQEKAFTTPCGVCRQFLAEFASEKDFPLYAAKPGKPGESPGLVLCTSVGELLPLSFEFFDKK